jgi:hypothetical protein
VDVFGEGRYSEEWQTLSDEAWPRIDALATGMAQSFDRLASALEDVLRSLPDSEVSPGSTDTVTGGIPRTRGSRSQAVSAWRREPEWAVKDSNLRPCG